MRVLDQGPVSFIRFLGLDGPESDATMLCLFRELLVNTNASDKLVACFSALLINLGYLPIGGQIIRATIFPAP